jgi:uncharacterized membrane protein (UPF0182 family)
MFQSGYLLLILLAVLPLGRTLLQGSAGGSPVVFAHRLYRDLAYIAAAVLWIVCFEAALTISLQNYWFDELGQRYRYWLTLGLRAGIFVTAFLSIGIFAGFNLRSLCRPLPVVPSSAPWVAAFLVAGVIALGATTLWLPLLGFLGATATGTSDPVFANDISFYLLALPWYDDLVDLVMTALVIVAALWAAIGLGLYPSSGRPLDHFNDYLAQRRTPSPGVLGAVDAWRALEPQLQQIQGLRPYYTFAGVDIDRYMIDGVERQVMITARELNVERLPDQAKVWVNLALKYTHGYGAVAVPANEMDSRGNPLLWAHDIPLAAKGDLAVKQGAIYYGALTRDRVYVRTTEKEFDFPQGQANAETVYQGKGGIALSSFWRKLVVAHETDGLRLFISDYFTPDSRVLLRRNIVERVERLAPFLSFDRDPYIVADGDHYSYVIDAYTSSANYPYSEAYQGSLPSLRGRNYLRNSVKAVVDAYNGSVTFYVFDNRDPILRAYRKMLPGLFRDRGEMPPNLQRHVRYPEDLFTVQAEMYGTYHMTNPTTFYNREDRWEVPHELYRDREIEVRPYYVIAQLPNAARPEFLLMLPLSVAGKNQMAGWLAGLSDGDNYGKMVAFRFPKGTFIDGPAQVESRINSDSRFSGDLTLWDQHGSQVIRGNLIVLPLNGNQLIAIEPVYIEAEQTKIPTLARIVLAQLLPDDRKIEWAKSLRDAEDLLVGASARPSASSVNTETDDRLGRARAVFHDMQQQYASGNYARYGELLQQLEKLLTPP